MKKLKTKRLTAIRMSVSEWQRRFEKLPPGVSVSKEPGRTVIVDLNLPKRSNKL